jgi:membrane-bound ClpP family serine protease
MSFASLTRWIVSSEMSPTTGKYLAATVRASEISTNMRFLVLSLVFVAFLMPLHAEENSISKGSVVVLPVQGMVSEAMIFFLRRALKNAEAVAAAAIVLDMDTPGGDLKATEKIVQMFSGSPIPTYTYVNSNAGSAGALIALGTKKIYMAPVSAIGAAAPVAGSGQAGSRYRGGQGESTRYRLSIESAGSGSRPCSARRALRGSAIRSWRVKVPAAMTSTEA